MSQYSISVDFDLQAIKDLSTPFSIGQLRHEHAFSWSPTTTPTNSEDRFFAVPMQVPVPGDLIDRG